MVKSFAPQGETGNWAFFSDCMTLSQAWGLWPDCVSAFPTHFIVYLLTGPMCRSHSAGFCISFIGKCHVNSYTAGASMKAGELRSFLCHHLDPLSQASHSIVNSEKPVKQHYKNAISKIQNVGNSKGKVTWFL